MFDGVEAMHSACVQSSVVAAHLSCSLLASGGLLALTGSAAALAPTPGMVGYGMAKAATHHLVSTVAASGLPEGAKVVGLLPSVIDTPGNRAGMPDADTSTWTPAADIAQKAMDLVSQSSVTSGALYEPVTAGGHTSWEER